MAERAVQMARQASRMGAPRDGLAAVAELRREVEALEIAQVRHALAQGWSWSRIAEALGVSKQAAHKKHASRPAPPAPPTAEERRRLVITGQARRAVEHGRQEAAALGHSTVEPQHLLLGLLNSREGAASAALRGAGVELDQARAEARAMSGAEPASGSASPSRGRLPVSARVRATFEQSLREAVARDAGHLGEEHVLLAMLRDPDGETVEILGRLGAPPGRLHDLLERTIAEAGPRPEGADAER